MSNIYFISDTHFGHANIASEKTSRWKGGWRKYESLDEMNQDLIRSINSVVDTDDTLYHIGDWSFGGIDNIWKFRSQINCQNIHLILGNHDHHIEDNRFLPGIELNAHDIFSSVSHYKEITHHGQPIVMSHYPMAVWHGNGKDWWHLHGHCHGSFKSIGKSFDVGVDVAIKQFGEPRPYSFNEIVAIMDKKNTELLDHHGPNTNTGKRPR